MGLKYPEGLDYSYLCLWAQGLCATALPWIFNLASYKETIFKVIHSVNVKQSASVGGTSEVLKSKLNSDVVRDYLD